MKLADLQKTYRDLSESETPDPIKLREAQERLNDARQLRNVERQIAAEADRLGGFDRLPASYDLLMAKGDRLRKKLRMCYEIETDSFRICR